VAYDKELYLVGGKDENKKNPQSGLQINISRVHYAVLLIQSRRAKHLTKKFSVIGEIITPICN
jgi:hypothetical protein